MSQIVTLTPASHSCSHTSSSVKSLSFFLLFVGIIFITVGYVRQEREEIARKVEFRYVPRSFDEEQAETKPVLSIFGQMFSDRGPWEKINGYVDTYPWQRQMINSRVVHPYNNPTSGFGKSVGEKVL